VTARRATLACLASLLALAAPAAAAPPAAPAGPWATVNVCDTAQYPDTIGIRGSMPGSGSPKDDLFMRIQVQYFDATIVGWRFVGTSADSGFLELGSGKAKRREGGQNFTINPRKLAYVLRGYVTFEWRRGGDVVKRQRRLTKPGHPATPGADPAAFSAASCAIS
jgi:hypothetical protein